jgi:PAS domain S-box-containing protein
VPGRALVGDEIQSALETVSIPSYVVDQGGVVRWLNLAASTRLGDIRGHTFTSVVAPEDRRRWRELVAHTMAGQQSVTDDEFMLVDVAGNRVSVECSCAPMVRGERVVGVFGQIKREREAAPAASHQRLTPRQAEILDMLELGRSTEQIARDLHLSRETVRNHVRHVLRALGVHSRLEAVAVARLRSRA